MLTIVIPNRNRNLTTVQRTLASLAPQLNKEIQAVVVDYGSEEDYQVLLKEQIDLLDGVEGIYCPTQGQLWNKSRAINIVLRTCETPFFMVADMDMIFYPQFFGDILPKLSLEKTIYFPVGVLTKNESSNEQNFDQYQVKFITNEDATGISIFPTEILKSINGFDEFYHGWGAEDTDVHVRLRNTGHKVLFRKGSLYFLHQWHPKEYRSKESKAPYHSTLEQINASYLAMAKIHKCTLANHNIAWGQLPLSLPANSKALLQEYYNVEAEIKAFGSKLQELSHGEFLHAFITEHPDYKSPKIAVKRLVGKKTTTFMELDAANDYILGCLLGVLRNSAYAYAYDRQKKSITLHISIVK